MLTWALVSSNVPSNALWGHLLPDTVSVASPAHTPGLCQEDDKIDFLVPGMVRYAGAEAAATIGGW